MKHRLCGVFIILSLAMAGCGGHSLTPTKPSDTTRSAAEDYQITFSNGHTATFSNAFLSYKPGRTGNEKWLSVRIPFTDMQYLSTAIRGIRQLIGAQTIPVDPSSIQMRTSFLIAPPQITPPGGSDGIQPLCTVVPLSSGVRPMCSGGSDCTIMDGSCVNTNGDCVMSDPCGANSSAPGDGVGVGHVGFGDGFGCNIDFSTDYVDCLYDNNSGPSYTDANLYLAYVLEPEFSWTVVCANPQTWGWAMAHYFDLASNGGHFRFVNSAPGQHQWNYPRDFPAINVQSPPSPPVLFNSSYFAFGTFPHLFPYREGHCNVTMTT